MSWIKKQPRLELIALPEYLNICVRVLPPHDLERKAEWSKNVREKLKEKNIAFVNFSSNAEGTFLRLILAHPKLQLSQIEHILLEALNIQ